MRVNKKRTHVVFNRLVRSFEKREFPYGDAVRPQDIVGEGLEKYDLRSQANFWFFACMYMRGPLDSNQAVKKLFEIFESHGGGGIFDPHDIRSKRESFVVRAMEEAGHTRMLRDVRKFWTQGARKIAEEYQGDCRNIYNRGLSFDEIAEICCYVRGTVRTPPVGFMGFQKKMVSMLTYFLRERCLISIDDFPPPVDFHLMRIMINTGVLVFEESDDPSRFRYETSSPTGYEAVEYYLASTGVDPVVLGDALWLLSGNLCEKSPRNTASLQFGTMDKSSIEKASLARRKQLEKHPGIFTVDDLPPYHIDGRSLKIRETCWKCPAVDFCRSGIPSTDYYINGHLRVINRINPRDVRARRQHISLLTRASGPKIQIPDETAVQDPLFQNLHTQRRPPKEVVV